LSRHVSEQKLSLIISAHV